MTNPFLSAVAPKGKYIKFAQVGDAIDGIISAPISERQSKEYAPGGNGPLKFWKNGDPVMEQLIYLDDVSAASQEEAASIVVVDKPAMRKAIGEALVAAGVEELVVGGRLRIEFSGFGTGKNPANPPKSFVAQYAAPATPAGGNWAQ